jgi:ferrous iron transport protein B
LWFDDTVPAMEAPLMHLALVGTPNSGKTSLFNALTGSRQKVANYPGVTVERKEGSFVTPLGRQVSLVDLPGTYSLRGRSPDEEITRDVVLGRTPGEAVPDLVLCVADSTNLRLTIRLVLELKSTGRPLLLVLNMFDIATRRGVSVDVARLSEALGVPVVTSIAVRKGGTADLLRRTDEISAQAPVPLRQNLWQPLTVAGLRATQREADRIIAATISLPSRPDTWTARVDAVVLHPVAGLAILAVILFVMFQAVFAWAQPLMDLLSSAFIALGQLVHDTLPAGLLQSFLQNGVISGVGSVIVFLPQIIIIFLFILLLEDFGYMARAAFLMDRIMGGAGLHGRAFIPLLSSFACAIPGIMATRVIDNRRDRLTTILIAPLMTCSARIPVYTLIISAFIPARQIGGWVNLQGLVMFGLYAVGIASALGVSFVIKFFMLRDYAPAPFMLELPDYKMPRAGSVAIGIYTRAKMFLHRAGTTIFSMMVLIWFLASFPLPPAGATDPAINYSFAAMIGRALEPLLMPIGFNWQIAVALIPGMAAREVAVAALGTVYAIEGGKEAVDQIGQVLATKWSLATALSLLAWYIFAPQCASTLAVIRRETGSWKWMAITFGYMLALAYLASLATYNIAYALGAG